MYVIRRLTLSKANPDPGEKPMRASKTLKKLRSGRCARVCGMGHYLPFYIRYAPTSDSTSSGWTSNTGP